MKSQFQILSFLSNYAPKSSIDAQMIDAYLHYIFRIPPKTLRNAPNFDDNGLDVQSFTLWVKNGSEPLKIGRFKNHLIILGVCTLKSCQIIGTLLEDGTISTENCLADQELIEDITEEEQKQFLQALLDSNLEPNPNTLQLVTKYTPKPNERVIFYDYTQEIQGVGVIRDIDAEGFVTFYCYFTYPTYSQPKRVGYSMHEKPGYNIRSIIFESIEAENIQTTLGNSTSCFRRLGKELERVHKVWKDKILRVEDLNIEQPKGGKYFYISDKLVVVQETEKGTPTSHLRYLAGNYFVTYESAETMLNRFKEIIKDYLASDDWPQLK